MITCSVCLYKENSDSAMICIKCGSELPDTRASLIRRPVATDLLSPESVLAEARVRNRHEGTLKRTDVAIYVSDTDLPMLITLSRELLLGRFGSSKPDVGLPVVDLVNFGAMENGVSRRHALLRRLGSDVVIIDQTSTNGTWLNGVQLKAQQPVMLRSGDRVMLARLMLQIFLA